MDPNSMVVILFLLLFGECTCSTTTTTAATWIMVTHYDNCVLQDEMINLLGPRKMILFRIDNDVLRI